MKITNLAHAAYRVKDRENAVRFYRDVLGLKEKFTIRCDEELEFQAAHGAAPTAKEYADAMRRLGSQVWITYFEVAPHQYLELFSPEGGETEMTFGLDHFDHIGYLHLALEVDDVQKAFQEMKKQGVRILSEPSLGVEHTWQFWIQDPDGNAIELMQYTEDSWQLS